MAKKYVIFTPSIVDMGGAQMYVRNKSIAMQERGWVVDIITAQRGKIYIQDLRKYDYVVPELAFDYFLFSKRKRDKIVKEIVAKILDAEYEQIIIESTCISECTWAEVVAENCGAINFCYILQEHNYLGSKIEQNFFAFKQSRRELVGITDKSIYEMFRTFSPISKSESLSLPAYCNNVVEDIDYSSILTLDIHKYDYVIGMLSRIDKPFIAHALQDIIRYVKAHTDKHFSLIMIGGAPQGASAYNKIYKLFRGIDNIDLYITGYVFPVPIKLLELCDVHISSAGSSWVSSRSGVPTITYDGNDYSPIGILERTTKHSLFRDEKEKPIDLSILLDDILVAKKYCKTASHYDSDVMDFSSHIAALEKIVPNENYFQFTQMSMSTSELQLSFTLSLIGPKNYITLSKLKKIISNRLKTIYF